MLLDSTKSDNRAQLAQQALHTRSRGAHTLAHWGDPSLPHSDIQLLQLMINSSEEKAGLAMSPAVHFQPASNSSNGDIEPAAWSSPDSPSFGLARRQRRTRIIAMAGISSLAVFAIGGFGVFLVTTLGGAGRTPHLKDANWKLVPQTVDDEALQSYTACTWANSTLPDFIIPRKYEVELQVRCESRKEPCAADWTHETCLLLLVWAASHTVCAEGCRTQNCL